MAQQGRRMVFSRCAQWLHLLVFSTVLWGCGGGSSSTNNTANSSIADASSSSISYSSSSVLSVVSSSLSSQPVSTQSISSLSSVQSTSSAMLSSTSSSHISSRAESSSSVSEKEFEPVSLQSQINRVQPMTGIVFWSDNTSALSALGQDVQLEFSYMLYRDVVTRIGTYSWAAVDQKLAQAAARGHQMIFRFRDTYPGITQSSIPDGLPYHISKVEGQNTFIPDWSSTGLREFILDFFTRFAARYDNDPRLAFVQVGFGSYAEYHLYDGQPELGKNFPDKSFQANFLNHMAEVFSQTPWSISIDATSSDYSPFQATPALKNLRFGLFDDSFMHKEHSENDSEYNRASWLFFGANRYHTNPAGGEFSYYSTYDQRNVLSTNGPYGKTFEDFAHQYNVTYMIGNDQYAYQSKARIRQAAMATGYAFRLTLLESNGNRVRLRIRNEGIAPLYYDAYPSVNNQRATQSLKGLLPSNSLDMEIHPGTHNPLDIQIKIDSDRLVTGQVIQFNANL